MSSFFPFKITDVFGCVRAQRWPAGSSLNQAGSLAAEHGPPVVAGLSHGPRGLPYTRQDLQSMDPQSWRGSAVARGVFLVSGRICRARTPSRGGAQRWPAGSTVPGRQHLQHVGSPLDPRAAQLLHSMWDSHPPAQDRACVPCIARQVLTRWTTREVSLLYF